MKRYEALKDMAMIVLFKALCLLLASILVGMFVTLQLSNVLAQSSPMAERVAILESRQLDNRDVIAQIRAEIALSRAAADQNRQHIDELQNKLSVITGIGIGLSSIMMILQLVQTVSGLHIKKRDELLP